MFNQAITYRGACPNLHSNSVQEVSYIYRLPVPYQVTIEVHWKDSINLVFDPYVLFFTRKWQSKRGMNTFK